MKYKEFKNAVEDWGRRHNYRIVVEGEFSNIYIALKGDGYLDLLCEIHKTQRFVIDLNWDSYRNLTENEKEELFKIVTEFATTKPADREDEKRFIIPLPGLVTTDGEQQYLTKNGSFFASRRDKNLRQTWETEHLKLVPEIYRQFAVEFDEDKEY